MPSAYSLDDQDGQVIAVFDTTTSWRTGLVYVGIDTAICDQVERRSGWAPLVEARVGLGGGRMSYDRHGTSDIAAKYGYRVDDGDGFTIAAEADASLGIRGSFKVAGALVQAAAGGSIRYLWLGTSPTASADPDVLVLNSSVGMTTYGGFGRLTLIF